MIMVIVITSQKHHESDYAMGLVIFYLIYIQRQKIDIDVKSFIQEQL